MIHTSCRSESSNISLVVLDKVSLTPNGPHPRLQTGMHFYRETSQLIKLHPLSPEVTPSSRSPTCLRPQTWRGFKAKSSRSRKRETPASSVATTAGHLSAEIATSISTDINQKPGLSQRLHSKIGNICFSPNKKKSVYSTMYSQAVTHPSTNMAQCCLTSVIRRELVFST